MSDHVLDQVEIENAIRDDLRRLAKATTNYETLLREEAEADVAYKKKKAQTYYGAEGPVRDKEAAADIASTNEYRAYKIAEAAVKAQKELLWTLRARVDALRTLNANFREQV